MRNATKNLSSEIRRSTYNQRRAERENVLVEVARIRAELMIVDRLTKVLSNENRARVTRAISVLTDILIDDDRGCP